jgi:DNA-binding CsgD family transcriptional regulator
MEDAMNKHIEHNKATYGPQEFKTYESALCSFFKNECPQLGGLCTRQALVQALSEMRRAFFPETSHLAPGQTLWTAVHKDAKGHYGKKMIDTELTSVVLDLLPAEEISQRAGGKKLRDVKVDAAGRLFEQAFSQDGVLTNAEVALLLKISPATVTNYTRAWEEKNGRTLPRRGTIHDMGPTLTHKRIIIHKLFIEQKTVEAVAKETNHSFEAIQRYIGDFRRVLLCKKNGMTTEQIANVIRHSIRLVREYETIIEHYAEQSKELNELLEFHPAIK